jgi:Zn-dependent protease with chaperone function
MNQITNIFFAKGMANNVAQCNRQTGELYLNVDMWDNLTEEQQAFIVYHEEGHIVLQTKNEFEADAYAVEKYFNSGLPLHKVIHAFTGVLSFSTPEHEARLHKAYSHFLYLDYTINKNKKAGKKLGLI